MRGRFLLALCAWCCSALNSPNLPRRAVLRGAAGALSLAPFAASAVPDVGGVRRFGAGGQSRNSVADEQTKLVWTPRQEVGTRIIDEGYSGYAYPQRFVTYLARFLLRFDAASAGWWRSKLAALPAGWSDARAQAEMSNLVGALGASLAYGLAPFAAADAAGAASLFKRLSAAYGAQAEAPAQLALMFSLLAAERQPAELMRAALPLAHLVWGLWALCALPAAAAAGKLQPFSHIEYAERRLSAYEAACVL